jgi:hypothetical protein
MGYSENCSPCFVSKQRVHSFECEVRYGKALKAELWQLCSTLSYARVVDEGACVKTNS